MSQPTSEHDSSASSPVSQAREGAATAAAGRPYVRPALQRYGKLVDVTGFGGSQTVDSGLGSLQTP